MISPWLEYSQIYLHIRWSEIPFTLCRDERELLFEESNPLWRGTTSCRNYHTKRLFYHPSPVRSKLSASTNAKISCLWKAARSQVVGLISSSLFGLSCMQQWDCIPHAKKWTVPWSNANARIWGMRWCSFSSHIISKQSTPCPLCAFTVRSTAFSQV